MQIKTSQNTMLKLLHLCFSCHYSVQSGLHYSVQSDNTVHEDLLHVSDLNCLQLSSQAACRLWFTNMQSRPWPYPANYSSLQQVC